MLPQTQGLLFNYYTYNLYEVITDRQRILRDAETKPSMAWLLPDRTPSPYAAPGRAEGRLKRHPRAAPHCGVRPPPSALPPCRSTAGRVQPAAQHVSPHAIPGSPFCSSPPWWSPAAATSTCPAREGKGSAAGNGGLACLNVWAVGEACSEAGPRPEWWQHPGPRSAASPTAAA